MARPKSGKPTKDKINLSVSAQTKLELQFISELRGISISNVIAEFSEKEARRLAKSTGKSYPDANQMTIDDLTPNNQNTH